MQYEFDKDHPMQPLRLQLTLELVEDLGLLEDPAVVKIRPTRANDEKLSRIHDRHYIEAVKLLSAQSANSRRRSLAEHYGFTSVDNPAFPGMHEAAAAIVGGTVAGAEAIVTQRVQRAFHPGGGLHHAFYDRAAGFCVYNDAVAAIHRFLDRGWRVMYIDGDAHHGDGVEAAFADDPRVFTVSFHEDGRFLFPGTGFAEDIGRDEGLGFSANVPLLPGTDDQSWQEVIESTLTTLVHAFEPDVIISQHGCDAHYLDPLSHLNLSTKGLELFARCLDTLSRDVCGGRWLALGGGGYDIWRVVPRAWALVWGVVAGQKVPDQVPAGWLDRWQPLSPHQLLATVRDDPAAIAALARDNPGLSWDAPPAAGTVYGDLPSAKTVNLTMARQALNLCLPHLLGHLPVDRVPRA